MKKWNGAELSLKADHKGIHIRLLSQCSGMEWMNET
jgi:hypothetical protein